MSLPYKTTLGLPSLLLRSLVIGQPLTACNSEFTLIGITNILSCKSKHFQKEKKICKF